MTSNFRKTIVLKKWYYNTKADLRVFSTGSFVRGSTLHSVVSQKQADSQADSAYNLKGPLLNSLTQSFVLFRFCPRIRTAWVQFITLNGSILQAKLTDKPICWAIGETKTTSQQTNLSAEPLGKQKQSANKQTYQLSHWGNKNNRPTNQPISWAIGETKTISLSSQISLP